MSRKETKEVVELLNYLLDEAAKCRGFNVDTRVRIQA